LAQRRVQGAEILLNLGRCLLPSGVAYAVGLLGAVDEDKRNGDGVFDDAEKLHHIRLDPALCRLLQQRRNGGVLAVNLVEDLAVLDLLLPEKYLLLVLPLDAGPAVAI